MLACLMHSQGLLRGSSLYQSPLFIVIHCCPAFLLLLLLQQDLDLKEAIIV
jgi:hypothetical protein